MCPRLVPPFWRTEQGAERLAGFLWRRYANLFGPSFLFCIGKDGLVKRKLKEFDMNTPIPFEYEGKSVRVVNKEGEPWWVAKDVCDVLGLTNATVAIQSLDADEVTKFNLGGLQGETNIINEPGLYSLILRSRKPEAKAFKRWITHEVLPSIRQKGEYVAPETQSVPDAIEAALIDEIEALPPIERAKLQIVMNKPDFSERLAIVAESKLAEEVNAMSQNPDPALPPKRLPVKSKTAGTNGQFMDDAELCETLQISVVTLRRYMQSGPPRKRYANTGDIRTIRHITVGGMRRWNRESAMAFINGEEG